MKTKKDCIRKLITVDEYVSLNEIESSCNMKRSLAKKYLGELKSKGELREAGRGYYTTRSNDYKWIESSRTQTIKKIIKRHYPDIKFIVWNTMDLQEFFRHTQTHGITFIETEKDAMYPIYELLLKSYRMTIIERKTRLYYNSIDFYVKPIVIRQLIVRSPIKNTFPMMEKLIIDIYKDMRKYGYISEEDYWEMCNEYETRYIVHYGDLITYLKRRKCFTEYIEQATANRVFTKVTNG